jgi:small subunit ribosomal protein S16
MAVKLRLTRIGKKKAPFYRIVAIDSRKKRDGAFLENLGTYDALKGNLVIKMKVLKNGFLMGQFLQIQYADS